MLIEAAVAVVALLWLWRHFTFVPVKSLPLPPVRERVEHRSKKNTKAITVVVVGGAGNIGSLVVDQLLDDAAVGSVVVADVAPCPARFVDESRVRYARVDITQAAQVDDAMRGADACIHLASAIDLRLTQYTVPFMRNINVVGTANIINACVSHGVRALVYTGSTAGRFQGHQPREPDAHLEDDPITGLNRIFSIGVPPSLYGSTKNEAEKHVLAANGRGGVLRTCVCSPHAVIGSRDGIYLEAEVRGEVEGPAQPRLARWEDLGEYGYSWNEDVARGHILAMHGLLDEREDVAGQTFFLINDNWGVKRFLHHFWDLMERRGGVAKGKPDYILEGFPLWAIMNVAAFVDWFTKGTKRWMFLQLTEHTFAFVRGDHSYSSEKAQRVLGLRFKPLEDVMDVIVEQMVANGQLPGPAASKTK